MSIITEDLIKEHTGEDGKVDYEAINESLGDKYIDKDTHQTQLNGAVAKTKGKYKSRIAELESKTVNTAGDNEAESQAEEEEQATKGMTKEEVDQYIASKFEQRDSEAAIAKELDSKVDDEFKDFVKYKMNNEKGFNLDEFLEKNNKYAKKVTTRSSTQSNSANRSSAHLSDRQKRILAAYKR